MMENVKTVDTAYALRELATRLRDEPCVAIDTEFVWERTYYARLGLVQAATANGVCFLLDPLAIPDLSPLGEVLADDRVAKILHDAPQDLMLLRRATGASTRRVFDTRLAAGFAGLSSVVSLSGLLSELLDVHLPKEHTRTDWTVRPLSPEVLEYAADDVRHLPRVAAILRERAREAGVETWLDEELATLDESSLYEEKTAGEVYLKIRAAESLPPRNLVVLRELAAWREEHARLLDRPRRWLAEDAELVAVALRMPERTDELRQCRELKPQTARRYGADLLAAVSRGMAIPETALPPPRIRPGRNRALRENVDEAVRRIRVCAENRKVDAQLVSSKSDVAMLLQEGAAARPTNHRLLRGWRADLIGEALASIL